MSVSLAGATRHPKIYGWTYPANKAKPWQGDRDGEGLIKVGFTDRDDVWERIRESLGASDPSHGDEELLLVESAITHDGRSFDDHDVHRELQRIGLRRVRRAGGGQTEWFECTKDEVLAAIDAVRKGHHLESMAPLQSFPMRAEQLDAVERTAAYFEAHAGDLRPPHFLWNAKMRFGKTFTAYQLAGQMGWTRILVLTYKPAVESSWREDLENHVDFNGWRFKGGADDVPDLDDPAPLVWFASFQDVLGTDDDGNPKIKNEDLYLVDWDVVVIDEYHFGAWREAARSLYLKDPDTGSEGDANEKKALEAPDLDDDFKATDLETALTIDVGHYLYLSGTPFRALTQGEFLEDQVFNWTYADEQRAKTTWSGPGPNPYAALPKMHLLTYEMPDQLRTVALNNQSEFSLTEFFRTETGEGGTPGFVHEQSVQKWLDLLRGQDLTGLWANVASHSRPPLPYEDTNLLRALQHTVWFLPGVDACKAMADLLAADYNTFFHDYEVIVAAGPGAGIGKKALGPVREAIGRIAQDTKTITLTCGKLMTGVTVPPWTGIFMLRELKSPETYFQAAFRVQSLWASKKVNPIKGGEDTLVHKGQCYVFDFAPNRALTLIVDYATRLRGDVASEQDKKAAVEEFMEFLPVLAFDGYGMNQLKAEDVLHLLTSGVSASMLARRWNSSELITLDIAAMEALLANPNLLASLEQIEQFRNITNDLTAMISTNRELKVKKVTKEKMSDEEKQQDREAKKKRDGLRQRLQRFITRIPAFMYLTDYREETIKDIIEQLETDLFQKVTGLTLSNFKQLVDAGVFNDAKMNDAVWKFRTFENPSLRYGDGVPEATTRGGWTLTRDERFAGLVFAGVLRPGDELHGNGGAVGVVTDDYGISVDGIRRESPDEAAQVASGGVVNDGWAFWRADTEYGEGTLAELRKVDARFASEERG